MTPIDWAMIAAWVVGTSAFGMCFRRRVATTDDYLLAGRRLRWWHIGMAQAGDAVDATDFVAVTGHGYRIGLTQLGYTWWGMGIGSILLSRYVAPLLFRTGVYTNAEYLELRFGPVLRVLSAVLQVLYRFVAMALVVYALATVFEQILGMDLWHGIWAAMGLALLYVFTSGQLGVVMAAIPQVGLMLFVAVVVFGYTLAETGGWDGFFDLAARHEHMVHLSGYSEPGIPGGVYLWGMILTLVTYPIVNQTVAQRILGAASEVDARKGTIACLGPWCLITGASILVGIMAVAVLPSVDNSSADAIFPLLMKRYLPPGMLGLGIAALTVASMSTAAGIGTAIAGLLTVDVFRMMQRPASSDRTRLLATRVFASAAIVCGTTFAMFIERYGGMIPFYVALTGTFFLPLTVPYLGGAWFSWVSRGAGTAALAAGIGVGAVLFLAPDRFPAWLSHDQWRPLWVLAAAWLGLFAWSLLENALWGRPRRTDLAGRLHIRDLGRSGTPEEIQSLLAAIPPPIRPGTENASRGACGTPSDTPWYAHPTTFEAVPLVILIVLMIWWW